MSTMEHHTKNTDIVSLATVDGDTENNDRHHESTSCDKSHSTLPDTLHNSSQRQSWTKFLIGDIYAEDDPREFTMRRKQAIIFTVALSGITGPLGSMIYMPGLLSVAKDLNTSATAVNGSVSAYVVFMGIAPLFWGSISDCYGRKRAYLLSTLLGLVASIICAVSKNVGMLIAFRAIQACGLCASQTLGAGVIADTIAVEKRGRAYGYFYIGPLVGPVIGPGVGGALCQFLGWQSTFYFLAILAFILLIMLALLLPETLRKKRTDESEKSRSASHDVLKAFVPMVAMIRDPTIVVVTAYSSVIFGSLYFLNPTITDTLQELYGYNEWQVGLCYLAFGVGLVAGSVFGGQLSDFVPRFLQKRGIDFYPEIRLRATVPSYVLLPAGYLIYGWTTEKGVGVYGPLIGLIVYSFGQMAAFTPTSVYLVDSKPGRSASAVGINNCVRSITAAIVAIFSTQAVNSAGTGVLFSILAGINVLNIGLVVLVMIYGRRWREKFEAKEKQTSKTASPPAELDTDLARTTSKLSVV